MNVCWEGGILRRFDFLDLFLFLHCCVVATDGILDL